MSCSGLPLDLLLEPLVPISVPLDCVLFEFLYALCFRLIARLMEPFIHGREYLAEVIFVGTLFSKISCMELLKSVHIASMFEWSFLVNLSEKLVRAFLISDGSAFFHRDICLLTGFGRKTLCWCRIGQYHDHGCLLMALACISVYSWNVWSR